MRDREATGGKRRGAVVLGVPILGLSMDEFLDLAFAAIRARRRALFTTANAHGVMVAQRQPRLLAHFRSADAVLPDGVSAVWGVRTCGGATAGRVAGPDFMELFLARAAREGVSVFLLGGTEETVRRLARQCRRRWPALLIKEALAPPFGEFSPEVDNALIDAIHAAAPDALFVGMTAPKQELWLSQRFGELDVAFAMGVGAAFDFLAGTKPRAPRVLGALGLEWLFRLLCEPRRLWRRNLDNARFLAYLARDRLAEAIRPAVASADARAGRRVALASCVSLGSLRSRVLDVSEGGLCLELGAPQRLGAPVRGTLELGDRQLPFAGLVAWQRRGDAPGPAQVRVGVRFTSAPAELASLAREEGRRDAPA